MRLEYVDIFYSHRFDPDTPLEETMGALDTAVRQGKARYVGISSYGPAADRGGGADPARARHAAADPPAVVLAAQPLDRGGAARRARARGRRRDRVLAARPGAADRPVPGRRARGLARADRQLLRRGDALAGEPRARAGTERGRAAARAVARADGDRLGAARSADHVRAARREQRARSSSRTWRRSTASTSTPPSSRRSTGTPSTAGSTSGPRRVPSNDLVRTGPRGPTDAERSEARTNLRRA